MESRRTILMNLFAGQPWRHRHSEQICGHGGQDKRGGKGGTNGESSTETYISICKIDRQWEFAV